MPGSELSPELQDFLRRYVPLIEEEMFSFLPLQEPGEFMYRPMRDYPERGGKRLRPALVLLACDALGGDLQKAIRTASAFEMFQSFAVIHDDIEDDSEFRRGKPCLHKLYGIPLSINVGDALYAKVFEILCANRGLLGCETSMELIDEMIRGSMQTLEGQAYDIGWIRQQHIPTEKEYMVMVRKKTGWYTGRGPCTAGAIVAGAGERERRQIGDFGEAMAVAFQIRDDVLNLLSPAKDEEEAPGLTSGGYGKERGGDIAEGKRTLMVIDLLGKCTPEEGAEVIEILSLHRDRTTQDQIEGVIGLIESYGSLQYADEVASRKAEEALSLLEQTRPSAARDLLEEMLRFFVQRAF